MQPPKLATLFLLTFIFTLTFGCTAQSPDADSHPGTFVSVAKKYANSRLDGYNLYIPKSCTEESAPFPLIVFLQGGLGVGGHIKAILNWELPKELKAATGLHNELDSLKLNTFVYVMPHISEGQFYQNVPALQQVITEVSRQYNIDEKRIYLTGLSRGGHGSWGVGSKIPDQFAAMAPICGAPHGIDDYSGLTDIPIWTAHNVNDDIIPYDETVETVGKIETLSGKTFHRSKTIAGADYQNHDRIFTSGRNDQKGHDAWTEMYNEVNFYKWLLRFERD